MASAMLSKDLLLLILQFLDEENMHESARRLEKETGVFFNCKYFEELITDGNWEEAESYLSGFIRLDENRYSMKIYFDLRKQRYLEALDRQDRAKAVEILVKDLKSFATFNQDLFKEMTQLLTLDNFRENYQLSTYKDTKTARTILVVELRKLVESNPALRDKLQFPSINSSRLRTLINQSLNWQHSPCKNHNHDVDLRSLLVDHSCRNANDPYAQLAANNQPLVSLPNGSLPMNSNGQFQPISAPGQSSFCAWVQNNSSITPHQAFPGAISIPSLPNSSILSRSLAEADHSMSRSRLPGLFHAQNHNSHPAVIDEVPKTVARTLNQVAVPTSMDFHPVQQTLLLVGSLVGDISLWDVSAKEKVVFKAFQVWDIGPNTMNLKSALIYDPRVSVKRVLWSPDGSLFGVAFSKSIVQLYTYFGGKDLRTHLEINAHSGSVNDLAFCNPGKQQLAVVTCSDDKTIKVWDVRTGANLFTFEGHDSSVHSVCPHSRENVHFLFSTSVDGKIKVWLYDSMGSRVDYDAPNHTCSRMAYSANGLRLFSCGTNKEGESHIVEWNENEGTIKRTYQGFHKRSLGSVQFDTCKNRLLAAGDDYSVKFWDIDSSSLLTTVDAEGGLQANPLIRFNKEGTLLAVSGNDNKIKILATFDGLRSIHTYETHSLVASRTVPDNSTMIGDIHMPRPAEEVIMPSSFGKVIEIKDPAQCQSMRLSSCVTPEKPISRLVYTNSGNGILALTLSAVHLLWKWPRNEHNTSGKATTKVAAEFQKPASGVLMTNDLENRATEEAPCCFALSKNDSYVMSASGGKISLFNMVTFKTMASFLLPPPMTTCLVFLPQDNNIMVVGMDDSSLTIYDVRQDSVINKLKGHSERVTSLAFSPVLNTLVSAGGDSQMIVWNSSTWERLKSCFLQVPDGKIPPSKAETQIQFHQDQIHLLAVNGSQIAIYDATKLKCTKQWVVPESWSPITNATFSCDSQIVYSCFLDGIVRIFASSNLQLQCQIKATAYFPQASLLARPRAIAAHPQKPNQFAIGLMDGAVQVFEPPDSEGRWFVPFAQPIENGSGSSIPASDKSQG